MSKRKPTEGLNDPGTNKKVNGNQKAPETTQNVPVDFARMNEQEPRSQQVPPQAPQPGVQPGTDFSSEFIDAINPDESSRTKREFILSYDEVRKMRADPDKEISYKIHPRTGISMYFAYRQLNDPQKSFIGKVFEALNRKMHTVIESSTGTGKTLSLLTSTLSWMEHARSVYDDVKRKKLNVNHKIENLEEANFTHVIYSSKTHSQLGQIQKELLKLPYRPKMVLFGSRDKLCNNSTVQWKHGINQDKDDQMKCKCNAAVKYMREFNQSPYQFNLALKQLKKNIHDFISKCFGDLQRQMNTDDLKEQFRCLKKMAQLYLLQFRQPMPQQQFENYKQQVDRLSKIVTIIEQKRKHENLTNNSQKIDQQTRKKNEMEKEFQQQMKKKNQKIILQMINKRSDIYYTNQLIKKCQKNRKLTQEQQNNLLNMTRQLWSMESRCPYYKKKLEGHDKQFYKHLNPGNHGMPLNIPIIMKEAQNYHHKVCTYLLPRRLDDQGDLYLMPYNYLLNQSLLPLVKRLVKNSILVFDEGHNVEESAREGYSVKLNKIIIKEALDQIKQKSPKDQDEKDIDQIQLETLQRQFRYENSYKQNLAEKVYQELRKQDIQRQKKIYRIRRDEQRRNRSRNNQFNPQSNNQNNMNQGNENDPEQPIPRFECLLSNDQLRGRLISWLIDFFKIINLNIEEFFSEDKRVANVFDQATNQGVDGYGYRDYACKHTPLVNEIREWMKRAVFGRLQLGFDWSLDQQIDDLNILKKVIKKLDQIIDLKFAMDKFNFKIKTLHRFFAKLQSVLYNEQYSQKYYLLMKQQKKWSNRDFKGEIELKCLTPQFAFKALKQLGPRSIIITSGTLQPIDRFQDGLGIKQNSLQFLQAGSIIKEQNIHVRKIGCNLDKQNQWITKKYFTNQDWLTKNANNTFNLLIQLIKRIPNGVLIIISSYQISEILQKFFKSPQGAQIRARFLKAKPFVQFEKKKSNAQKLIKKYNYFAKKKEGAALFCVCRAKLTQGIDFKNQLCRGVIVLGVPLKYDELPQVKQMKRYLQFVRKDISWDNWMLLQVTKSINQALGRVVRNQNDYGSIFLVDSRYNSNSYGSCDIIQNNISKWIRDHWKDVYSIPQLHRQFEELEAFFNGHQIRRKKQKEQKKARNENSSSDDQDGFDDKGNGRNNSLQSQSLSSTYNNRIQQRPQVRLPQMSMRQSVQNDLAQNQQKVVQEQNQIIPEQQDIELQKGIYQSIKDNQETLSVTNQLNAKLLAKGLTPIQIVGDGNCLYRSINYLQTSQGTPNQNQFDQIKQAVIQVLDRQLDAPPLIVYQILHGSQIDGNSDLQKVRNYRKKMSRKKQYGGSIELLAISYIYGVTLVVHKMHGTTEIYYPDPNTPITPDKVYHLGLYQFSDVIYDHYFALIPTNQTLSEYNIRNHKDDIQKWNRVQNQFVEPVIDKSSSKNLQSSIQDVPKTYNNQMINQTPNGQTINKNTTKTQVTQVTIKIRQQNIQKKPVKQIKQNNYKENEKPISQAERKHFSQNGRIVYSQNGTILRLTNFFKRFSVKELIQDSWENVQILEVQNCNITDPQWNFFVNNAHLFPNLRYINIESNRITRISRGDLQKFKNLRVINFKRLANCPYSTYEYLESLRQKYENSQDKSDLILPIFRK